VKIRPERCIHTLTYPVCGCVEPPTLATHLITERDRKKAEEKQAEKEKLKTRGRGRPKTTYQRDPDPDTLFLEKLPTILEDPYARKNLMRMVDAQLARADFAEFCRQAWHVVEPTTKLEWNWHHELICKIIQGLFEDWEHAQDDEEFKQRITQCILNVPPGSLKSRLIAVFFPAWAWTRRPGWRCICLSVNEDAAMRDARDSRTLIKSDWYQQSFTPDWQIKTEQDAISNYGNTKGGVRLSRAQGSEIVGLRGDALLVDDANNPKEAESKLVREDVNNLYTTNIHNRVNHPEKSLRIGIQQRTHAEDWTGYIIKHYGQWTEEDPNPHKWLYVVIPAEFEPERRATTPWGNDPRTEKGETLHPVRMSPALIEATRLQFGSQKYAGQYQQRPTLAEGGTVKMKWWRFFHYSDQTPIPQSDRKLGDEIDRQHPCKVVNKTHGYTARWDFDWTIISLDPAAKRTERGSQHGIIVMAGKGPQRFILDDKTCRGDVLDVLAIVEKLCKQYDPDRILVEAKAAGPALMTLFEDKFQRGKIVGSNGRPLAVRVDSIEPQGEKGQRLDACLAELEAGLVYLHDGAEWLEPFIGEVCAWPLGSHDDRTDSVSQALNHMRSYGSYQLPDW
jgi:predicted phage terminase large subunit-like protein